MSLASLHAGPRPIAVECKDPTLLHNFHEAQGTVERLSHMLQKMRVQQTVAERKDKTAEAELETLTSVPEETRIYQLVSRVFVLRPRDRLLNDVKKSREAANEQRDKLESIRIGIQTKLKDAQGQLMELQQQILEGASSRQ